MCLLLQATCRHFDAQTAWYVRVCESHTRGAAVHQQQHRQLLQCRTAPAGTARVGPLARGGTALAEQHGQQRRLRGAGTVDRPHAGHFEPIWGPDIKGVVCLMIRSKLLQVAYCQMSSTLMHVRTERDSLVAAARRERLHLHGSGLRI